MAIPVVPRAARRPRGKARRETLSGMFGRGATQSTRDASPLESSGGSCHGCRGQSARSRLVRGTWVGGLGRYLYLLAATSCGLDSSQVVLEGPVFEVAALEVVVAPARDEHQRDAWKTHEIQKREDPSPTCGVSARLPGRAYAWRGLLRQPPPAAPRPTVVSGAHAGSVLRLVPTVPVPIRIGTNLGFRLSSSAVSYAIVQPVDCRASPGRPTR